MTDKHKGAYKKMRSHLPNEAIKHYRNLQYHRSVILEGVRVIAFRNINHQTRVMKNLGMSQLIDDRDIDAVYNLMFQDQDLDPDLNSRRILEFVTWVPWEMYLCLLSAELESYRRESRRDPALLFDPLEALFQSNETTIQHLTTLRDKVLHPAKRIHLHDALDNFMETGGGIDGHYYSTVFKAQSAIDAYAAWLRWSLSELVGEELLRANKSSGPADKDKLSKLHKRWEVFSRPLPGLYNTPTDESTQTPFNLRTWYMLGLFRKHNVSHGPRYPSFVQEAKTDCVRILMRSLVLSNEFVNLLDISKLRAIRSRTELDAHSPFDLLVMDTSSITDQQAQNLIAPVRVSTALLAEPLRIYHQAVEEFPELRHDEIEGIAGPQAVPPKLRYFRNIVFHVASDNIDPDDTESVFVSQLGEHLHALSLLPHLMEFYMAVP